MTLRTSLLAVALKAAEDLRKECEERIGWTDTERSKRWQIVKSMMADLATSEPPAAHKMHCPRCGIRVETLYDVLPIHGEGKQCIASLMTVDNVLEAWGETTQRMVK